MKRVLCSALVVIFAFSAAFVTAEPKGDNRKDGREGHMERFSETMANAEKISVSGQLSLFNNRISIKSSDKTYYLAGIQQLIGFVSGLNEGATVKIDGVILPERTRRSTTDTTVSAPVAQTIMVNKVNVNGKDYSTEYAPR
ncbi:MAG: hypothetical protein Ta2A_09900 [Treponemataceae bacterium]|nr:MAG: hypothetical protein Ta2A_09900 [Treponemataceae bacterium]